MINVIGCNEAGEIIAQVKQRVYKIRPEDFAGWVTGFTVGYDTAVDDNDEAYNRKAMAQFEAEAVAAMPLTPEPLTPEPLTPEPLTPEPLTPEPLTPEPLTPEPLTPEPLTPEPLTPELKPLTVEDVRRAFKELEANGVERATITAAIKKYGKTLPEVPADKLQELLDEVRK